MLNSEGVLRIVLNDINKSFCFVSTIYTILNRFSNEFYDVYENNSVILLDGVFMKIVSPVKA